MIKLARHLSKKPGAVQGQSIRDLCPLEITRTDLQQHDLSVPGRQVIYQAPRSWLEMLYPNLTYFNEVDKGGHFAAWEEPGLFSDELRAAFRSLR